MELKDIIATAVQEYLGQHSIPSRCPKLPQRPPPSRRRNNYIVIDSVTGDGPIVITFTETNATVISDNTDNITNVTTAEYANPEFMSIIIKSIMERIETHQ